MALMDVNYDHAFEEQHEAVIANVIKKVVLHRNRLTYSRYRRNTHNFKHRNGDGGLESLLEIPFATGGAVSFCKSERRIRKLSPESEEDLQNRMHSTNEGRRLEAMKTNEDGWQVLVSIICIQAYFLTNGNTF